MKWSLGLGRVFGIQINIHFTFFILLAWVGLAEGISNGRWEAAVGGLIMFACLSVIIVLHELGHALAARYYGIRTRDITLLPIGGVARLERMPDKPYQEIVVALAGPAVNVALAAIILAILLVTGATIGWNFDLGFGGSLLVGLLQINVLLFLFNMLPAFPMDGGRVLRALLALVTDYVTATRIAARIGQGMAILFALAGLFLTGNGMLVLIALFVFSGAEQELAMVRTRALFAGVTVARLMATRFHVLRPDETLRQVADLVVHGFQHDFPVEDDGKVVGMIAKPDVLSALATERPGALVEEAMRRDFATLGPRDSLETAIARFQSSEQQALPVLHESRLVGLLTADRIGEFLMRQPRRPARDDGPPERAERLGPRVQGEDVV